MTTSQFWTVLVGTISIGSVYALVAVGIVVLFRTTGMLNFAQGVFMVAGAEIFYSAVTSYELHWLLALMVAGVVLAVAGGIIYLLMFRQLIGAGLITLVIVSLGLSVVGLMVVILIWGPNVKLLPAVVSFEPIHIAGSLTVTRVDIVTVLAAAVILVLLDLTLHRTRLGTRMESVAENSFLAALLGVNVHRMAVLAWAIAAGISAVAGALYVMRSSLDPGGINALGLVALPAVLIGGIDSVRGALVGGILLALAQNLATVWWGGEWATVAAYIALLAVLLLRPSGLFGKPEVVRI